MIRHEAGHGYALVTCDHCPPWRRLTGGRVASLLAAAEHVALVHGDTKRAGDLRQQAARKARRDTPPADE